jgi:hypothetical protein
MHSMCCLLPLWPLIPTSWPVEKTISSIGSRLKLEDMRAARAERDVGAQQARGPWPGWVCMHITICLVAPIHTHIKSAMWVFLQALSCHQAHCLKGTPSPKYSCTLFLCTPSCLLLSLGCKYSLVMDCLFLGLLSKWPGCCYPCWYVDLRGRSQKAENVSVFSL